MQKISWWRTSYGEKDIQKISDAIRNENISLGKVSEEFESALASKLNIPYVITTTSGSMALLMALMALDIKPGDEVIVPNRTWIATAHAPMMLGAKVVLVDVKPDLPVMDVSQLRKKITSRTKAIIPVPLNGHAVDMKPIWEIGEEYGCKIIEDAAQALFSKNSGAYMGTQSDAGCFSLSMAKLIPTGQGGFVVTKHKETYEKLKLIRSHGVIDVINNCQFNLPGFNFRFTDLQASIGIVQLNQVQERIAHINKVYEIYETELANFSFLKLIPVNIAQGEIPLYVEVLCETRDKLAAFFLSKGIQVRSFYPDLDTAEYLNCSGNFPNSRVYGMQGIVLPCGPAQPLDNIHQVLEVLSLYNKI